ncbi:MAG: hypothetical protein IPI23_07390 [Bacteroidetes bacterium]|nr:hypothetical protein [Bacteroidota bacterium]
MVRFGPKSFVVEKDDTVWTIIDSLPQNIVTSFGTLAVDTNNIFWGLAGGYDFGVSQII